MPIEKDIMRLIGALAVRQIQERIRTGKVEPGTSKAGTTLYQRGKLYRSIKYRIDGDAVVVSAGNANVPYATIHYEGGVIRPKNAQYLAIPITAQAKLHKPREYPGETFIAKGMIFLKEEGGVITPLYVLKKQVTMPARRYMFIDETGRNDMKRQVREWVENRLKELSNVV